MFEFIEKIMKMNLGRPLAPMGRTLLFDLCTII